MTDRHVEQWFCESGFEVTEIRGLQAPVEDQIVNITPPELEHRLRRVDAQDVEAWVHVGASIAMARLVGRFEETFGKPVVSVNVACWWATLRASGIDDRIDGYGALLRDF